MAGRIPVQGNPQAFWPWPRNVREKLVDRAQLDRTKKKKGKVGDPKNPPLASAALLEFMGPGGTSESLRMPAPTHPGAADGRVGDATDSESLSSLAQRGGEGQTALMTRTLSTLPIPPERMERLRSLLQREAGMLSVMGRLNVDVQEIHRRIRDEQKMQGY